MSDPMMNRVQQSLSHVMWSSGSQSPDARSDDYPQQPVRSFRQAPQRGPVQQHACQFESPSTPDRSVRQRSTSSSSQRSGMSLTNRPVWRKPPPTFANLPCGLAEPGWVPKPKPAQYGSLGRQQQDRQPVIKSTPPRQRYEVPHLDNAEPPAWLGSLRSSGGVRDFDIKVSKTLLGEAADVPHEAPQHARQRAPQGPRPQVATEQPFSPKVQGVHYAPGRSPQYVQNPASHDDQNGTVKVGCLQYNNPIGLYSKESVMETLEGQTKGKPGYGTLQVVGGDSNKAFNPVESNVYHMVQEEDARQKHGSGGGGGGQSSGRVQAQQFRRQRPPAQSPPQQSNDHQGYNDNYYSQAGATGISDF